MSRPKGGLGRGLAALIPTGPTTNTVSDVLLANASSRNDIDFSREGHGRNGNDHHLSAVVNPPPTDLLDRATVPGAITGPRYEEISIDLITPNPRNPRTVFDEESLAELEHSLREFGMLQPIVVREAGAGYELVMGERRWRAAQHAGLLRVPAIVRRTEDADMLRDALLENIHRANLNPLEEAAAYQQLLEEFNVTHEELAMRLGRSRPVISNTIRLLKLPVVVQRRVAAGVLSAGHARALLSLDDAGDQEELATRVVAEGLSVRGTEEAVVLMVGKTVQARRASPKRLILPSLAALAGTLSDTFDTRVRVELGRQKGRLIVEFATVDDLERIVGIMAPKALDERTMSEQTHPGSEPTGTAQPPPAELDTTKT